MADCTPSSHQPLLLLCCGCGSRGLPVRVLAVLQASDPASFTELLSQQQLAHLLAHIPVKERMGSCSLVHSTFAAAAKLTVTEITTHNKAVGSLSTWLQAHVAKVPVRSISVKTKSWRDNRSSTNRLVLPVQQLRFLQSLTLDSISWAAAAAPEAATALPPAAAQPSSSGGSLLFGLLFGLSSTQGAAPAPGDALSSLTALTRLDLGGKSVALGGLSALTGLQELRCTSTARYEGNYGMTLDDIPGLGLTPDMRQDMLDSMFPDHSIPTFASAEAALVAALPHLGQSLTSLQLEQDMSSQPVVACLGSLTRLQRLLLPDTRASSFDGLPRTLTELRLMVRAAGIGAAGAHLWPVHANTIAALAQLSGVCVLHLGGIAGLDTAVFSAMSSLRELSLARVELAPTPGQLLFVSKLTALQSLRIKTGATRQQDITPAEAAALTAPQQLACLEISRLSLRGKLQEQQYRSMFPADRRLSSLTGLQVGTSLLQNAAVVALAARCCVPLTSLVLDWDHGSAAAGAGLAAEPAAQLAEGVRALTSFARLDSLTFDAPRKTLPRSIWSSLAALTGLRRLKVVSWQPDYSHAPALTRCQCLERLSLDRYDHAEDHAYECDIYLTPTTLDDKASWPAACVLIELACCLRRCDTKQASTAVLCVQ